MTKGVPQVREGIPIDALTEAKKSYENAKCKISRRNDKGQIAMVFGNCMRTIDELFDIDSWLAQMSGGGKYRVEVRDPNNPAVYIVPPFNVEVEGAPHKPKFLGNPVHNAPYGTPDPENLPPPPGGHGMYDPNQPPPPPWLQGVHPALHPYYAGNNRFHAPQGRPGGYPMPAPGATVASDQLAMKELGETKAALAEMRAELKNLGDKYETETTRLRDRVSDEREKAREVRHKADLEILQQRIELTNQQRQVQPESTNVEKYAWLAPVLVAYLESSGAKSTKAIEMQQSGMKTLLEAGMAQNNKADPGMEMMKTIVMPMMKAREENHGPKALSELYNATMENQLNSIAMMAQLIEASAPDEHWALPMIREALSGVMGVTEHLMQKDGADQKPPLQVKPGVPAPQQVTQQAEDAPAPQAAVYTTEPPTQTEQQTEQPAEISEQPEEPQNMKQVMMLGLLPRDFQTIEWKAIVLKLHNERDVEKVVNLITSHLQHLIDFEMLPERLADIVNNPEEALQRVLQPLPAFTQRKDFVEAVYSNVLIALREDGYIDLALDVDGEEVPNEEQAPMPLQSGEPQEPEPEPEVAQPQQEQPAAAG